MYYNKVELCGVNTAKLKTLNDEEKRALLLRVKEGDADARRELIDGNLRLVLSIVQRFANRRENMDDLFQVGCIGLIKAVDNFNTDLNVKFSTYAVPMNVRRGNQAAPMDGKSRQLAVAVFRGVLPKPPDPPRWWPSRWQSAPRCDARQGAPRS